MVAAKPSCSTATAWCPKDTGETIFVIKGGVHSRNPKYPPKPQSSTNASCLFLLMAGESTTININTAKASNPAEMGRVTNVDQSPRDSNIARRKFSSIMGPRMKPGMSGAGSQPNLMRKYPSTPKPATIQISKLLLFVENTPIAQNITMAGNNQR